jgi:hypothetical protein
MNNRDTHAVTALEARRANIAGFVLARLAFSNIPSASLHSSRVTQAGCSR